LFEFVGEERRQFYCQADIPSLFANAQFSVGREGIGDNYLCIAGYVGCRCVGIAFYFGLPIRRKISARAEPYDDRAGPCQRRPVGLEKAVIFPDSAADNGRAAKHVHFHGVGSLNTINNFCRPTKAFFCCKRVYVSRGNALVKVGLVLFLQEEYLLEDVDVRQRYAVIRIRGTVARFVFRDNMEAVFTVRRRQFPAVKSDDVFRRTSCSI